MNSTQQNGTVNTILDAYLEFGFTDTVNTCKYVERACEQIYEETVVVSQLDVKMVPQLL